MVEVTNETDTYLANFELLERKLAGNRPPWIRRIQKAAISRFNERGFPTTRDEEWKFTSVAPLLRIPFRPVSGYEVDGPTSSQLKRFTFGELDCIRLVFVNGRFSDELSSVRPMPSGMVVGSIAAAWDSHREWIEPHLASNSGCRDHPFVALNTAFLEDGAFVYLPAGKVVEQPIHLLFVSTSLEEATASHPRNLIVVGDNSQVAIVESYVGLDEGVYFTNAVTQIVAGRNAVIDHYKLQQESREAFHIATLAVHQDRSSNFTSHSISLGGALVRNDVNARLDAEGAECTLNGLYVAAGQQLIDNHTRIDHAKPHCASREFYKGILDGNARGVFNGKIYVHPDAQKTDAKQTNKTLLLSPAATINTKPQLEIFADDVKCTHGATVGQLDEDAIFYLRSRGIGQKDARGLLTYAFANDIVSRIEIPPIRAYVEEALLAGRKLSEVQEVGEAP